MLTDPLVLPAGSFLRPVSELAEEFRKQIVADEGDFVLSRTNSRSHSKVIDAEAASPIRHFEKPCTIAHAVARFSRGKAAPADQLLEEALPMLQSLIAVRLLVEAESAEAGEIQPSLAADNGIDGWAVMRCVQTLDDSEIYQVRNSSGQLAALKIARTGYESAGNALAWEARTLSLLDSTVTPRLLGVGEWMGRPYLATQWFTGIDAQAACIEFRQRSDAESRSEMLRLTTAILDAYAHLHEQGVVHGDIHPRNVLVDRHQAVMIIDLGLARSISDSVHGGSGQRGGVSFFFEPEFARAVLNGTWPPPSNLAGEQYALGALLYLLLIGEHYLDFSLEKEKMLRQIAEDPIVSFVQRGMGPWPEAERLLMRALSKDAAARFPSTREFAREWRAVKVLEPAALVSSKAHDTRLRGVRTEFLRRSALDGRLMHGEPLSPPTALLNYGSAGLAYALYRMACASDSAELLALADVWSNRSLREIGNERAFYNEDIEITPHTVGRNSLYHSPAGVYAVQALVAQARHDIAAQCAATEGFINSSQGPSTFLDLTLGRAGTLLGCVFLLDGWSAQDATIAAVEERNRLRSFGHELFKQLWHTVESYAPIRECTELSNLGIAHGWAGLLYAALSWCAAAGEPLSESISDRLLQLGECAEPVGRGLQWNWDLATGTGKPASGSMPGWCNGSAGYVFLWTEAHKVIGEKKYLELAEGAAWHVWETSSPIETLCCGMAGQAYALLNLYRHTNDTIWYRRACDAARRAGALSTGPRGNTGSNFRPEGLYKGDFGVALLDFELECPEDARMPMFEREI